VVKTIQLPDFFRARFEMLSSQSAASAFIFHGLLRRAISAGVRLRISKFI